MATEPLPQKKKEPVPAPAVPVVVSPVGTALASKYSSEQARWMELEKRRLATQFDPVGSTDASKKTDAEKKPLAPSKGSQKK